MNGHEWSGDPMDRKMSEGTALNGSFIMNRNFRLIANLVIIAVYAVFFLKAEGPWVRVSLIFGFAVLIRSLTFFAMTSPNSSLRERLKLPVFNLLIGSALFSALIGALYLIGVYFSSAQPVVKILLIILMAIVIVKSTFPLGEISEHPGDEGRY